MECNYLLNCVYVMFNVMVISNCFANNVFESALKEESQGYVYNSVHKRSLFDNQTNTQSTTQRPFNKKWQVGRVSRKHYEIINMLWRKTKVFVDIGTTEANQFRNNGTTKYEQYGHTKHTKIPFKSPSMEKYEKTASSSTASFIEFYYFDENDNTAKLKDPNMDNSNNISSKMKITKPDNMFNSAPLNLQSPAIVFRVNDRNYNPTTLTLNNIIKRKTERRSQRSKEFESWVQSGNDSKFENVLKSLKLMEILGNRTLFGQQFRNVSISLNGSFETTTAKMNIESTTANDKVKFFEMYDKHTSLYAMYPDVYDDFEKSLRAKSILNHEKNNLLSVDQNIGHSNNEKSRPKRKHITSLPSKTTKKPKDTISTQPLPSIKTNTTYGFRDNSALEELMQQTRYSRVANTSRLAYWSYYPFVAVYVYEPTQTHCDAAGISPHWLIAAGSCLSRHHAVHSFDAQSAYVAYCGESWRQPERIAYVKYSLVHPKFNPRDREMKYNYNIGLIQVSTSMPSTCKGWAPVALVSYHFTASTEGSLVSALGWGLDRYGTKYMSKKLPHWPLTVYEGLAFSDICPGSSAHSEAKRDAESGNNVYCLLLPPYLGEETDPVHGGLLIESGKLIALYLQEERRPFGPQSAQYTGVWRLFPWVLDVAREPEDLDSFLLDM